MEILCIVHIVMHEGLGDWKALEEVLLKLRLGPEIR